MNQNEQARLAAAVAILRPDWPIESLRTFIRRDDQLLSKRPFQDAAVALVYVACDPATKTPARVNESGPWWQIGHADPVPPSAVRCPRCGSLDMPDEATRHQCKRRSDRVGAFTDQLRAELRSVDVCPHGVQPSHCRDCTKAREHAAAESRRAEDTEETA